MDNDPLGLGNFNSQALHPDVATMNSGALPSRPQHAIAPAQGHSGIGGWLERNAENIGGIVGGIAGLPLNALDAVSGVGGTALDAGAAGIGEGIGQDIKNHFDPSQKTNALKEGAIGAATQAGGDVLGKALSPIAKRGASLLHNYGIDILSSVGGTLDKKAARALNARGTTDAMNDLGFGPKDFADVARKVTGPDGILNKIVSRGVGQADKVDTTGIKEMSSSLIGQDTRLDDNASKKAQSFIESGINKLNGVEDTNAPALTLKPGQVGPTDVLNKGADPNDTLQFARTLRSRAADLVGNGKNPLTVTDSSRGVANLYNHVADELEERLYTDGTTGAGVKGAGADKIAANGLVNDKDIANLKEVAPGNSKWSQFVDDNVKNADSIGKLRTLQRPFVNASKIAAEKAASKAGEGASRSTLIKGATGLGAVATAIPTHGASMLIPVAETDTGKTLINKGMQTGSKLLGKATTANPAGKVTIKDVVNKTLLQSFPKLFNTQNGQVTVNPSGGNQINGGPVSAMVTNSVNQIATQVHSQVNSATSGNQPLLQQLTPDEMQQILQTQGIHGLDAIESAISTNESVAKMTEPELSTGQQNDITLGLNSLSSLQQLAPLWEQAVSSGAGGGVQGALSKIPFVGGSAANLFSEANKNAPSSAGYKTYMDNRYDLATNIAKLLSGGGRTGGVSNTQFVEEMLPTLNDSPRTAAEKFQRVAEIIQSSLSNTLATPATNVPGTLTSFAGQSVTGTPNNSANNAFNSANPYYNFGNQ